MTRAEINPARSQKKNFNAFVDGQQFASDVVAMHVEYGALVIDVIDGTTMITAPGLWREAYTEITE